MLAIALPMMLANVTTPMLGIVDVAVIGQFGEAHLLGGVTLGSCSATLSTSLTSASTMAQCPIGI